MNNIARVAIAGLDERMVDMFEKGYPFLHAKRQASRRRRWFAFLRSQRKQISVPPKYIPTRWTIWRDCAEWWLDNVDLFKRFVAQEIGVQSASP